MKILCICNQGENRSRTTARMLNESGKHIARYDGFYKENFDSAKSEWIKFDESNLEWAEKIIVYEPKHESCLKKYGWWYWGKSYNLNIPDIYTYDQIELINIVIEKLVKYGIL